MDASAKLTLDRFIADPDSAGPLNEEQLRDLLIESTERRSALKELEARIIWRLLAERNAGVKSDGFPRLLTAGQLAEQFRVPECWVREQASSGELPNIKLGTYVRFRLDDVKRAIAQTAGWGPELQGAPTPPSLGVRAGWLQSKMDRRPSYTEGLRARLDTYLLPRFGSQRLDQVSVSAIEKMRDDMRTLGRSTITINATIRMIGGIYEMAIRRGLCTANPADRVERAYPGDRELNAVEDIQADQATPETVLSPEEISAMLDHADLGLYKTLLTLLAATGLRSGEALALRWSDCQLGGPEPKIFVRRSLSWARTHGEDVRPRFYPPKTKSGHRMITIPPELASLIKKWQIQCPPGEYELVFPNPEGKPLRRSVALRRGLWPALRRAGLRRVNIHSLRHSFASALIAAGSPVTEVQSILGHSSPAITLNVYAHWFRATKTTAMASVVRTLLKTKSEKSGQKVDTKAAQTPARRRRAIHSILKNSR
jgi:integrase